MKIRSNLLHSYLLLAGVLNGPEEAIAAAKADYRRLYKRNWKKQSRPKKEIRFEVTLKEFAAIKAKASKRNVRHTSYVKAIALESIGQPSAFDDRLLDLLQLVSMAVNATSKHNSTDPAHSLLLQVEGLLLISLNRNER